MHRARAKKEFRSLELRPKELRDDPVLWDPTLASKFDLHLPAPGGTPAKPSRAAKDKSPAARPPARASPRNGVATSRKRPAPPPDDMSNGNAATAAAAGTAETAPRESLKVRIDLRRESDVMERSGPRLVMKMPAARERPPRQRKPTTKMLGYILDH